MMQELTLPDGLPFHYLHRGECLFLHDEIFRRRCYAQPPLRLAPGAVIVDVGANIGMASLFFHLECPGAEIFAFEPGPRAFPVLCANVRRHRMRARTFACALGRRAGLATFTEYTDKSTLSGLHADLEQDRAAARAYLVNAEVAAADADLLLAGAFGSQTVTCEVRTLSDVIDELAIERIDLLKIDVERAELDVLAGVAPAHWPRIEQVAVEVHDAGGRLAEVAGLFAGHGFEVQVTRDPLLAGTPLCDVIAVRRPISRAR